MGCGMDRSAKAILLIVGLAIAMPAWPAGDQIHGKVTSVIDGDTMWIMIDSKKEKIRVYGINAPERKDPCFMTARRFAEEMVEGKNVTLYYKGWDRFGSRLAFVLVGEEPDRKSLGLELVKNGLAIVYSTRFRPEYPDTFARYQDAQRSAMSRRLCVWRSGSPDAK